jgi:hypothetical protein
MPAFATSLVTNGSFESNGGNGQLGFNTVATDWSVPPIPRSYTFVFTPGTADTSGATGEYGFFALWGPGNGAPNGLPATSPDGGDYIAQDADFQQGAISQTIHGLTPGAQYTVGFWWGAAQQESFDGATHSEWQVSLGSQMQSTGPVTIPNHGFSGWMHQTLTFTANNTSELLSFFAAGAPPVPPFALLDGVTLNGGVATPEPDTLVLMGTGLAGFIGFARRHHVKKRR